MLYVLEKQRKEAGSNGMVALESFSSVLEDSFENLYK